MVCTWQLTPTNQSPALGLLTNGRLSTIWPQPGIMGTAQSGRGDELYRTLSHCHVSTQVPCCTKADPRPPRLSPWLIIFSMIKSQPGLLCDVKNLLEFRIIRNPEQSLLGIDKMRKVINVCVEIMKELTIEWDAAIKYQSGQILDKTVDYE